MVGLVERMLELHKKKATEKNPNILKQLETQIAATDRQSYLAGGLVVAIVALAATLQ